MAATISETWERVTDAEAPADAFGDTLNFVIPAEGLVGDLFLDLTSSGALGGGALCDFPALAVIDSIAITATGGATLHSYDYMPVCEYMLAKEKSATIRAAVLTNSGGSGATALAAHAAPVFAFWTSWANDGKAAPLYMEGSDSTVTVSVTFRAGSSISGNLGTLTLSGVGLNYRLYSVDESEFAGYSSLLSAGQLIYPSQDWTTIVQQAVTAAPGNIDASDVLDVTPTTRKLLALQLRTVTQAAYTARTYMIKTNLTSYSVTSATTPVTTLQATQSGALARDAAGSLNRDSAVTTGFTNYTGSLYWIVPARQASDCPTIASFAGLTVADVTAAGDSWLDVLAVTSARYAFSTAGVLTRT